MLFLLLVNKHIYMLPIYFYINNSIHLNAMLFSSELRYEKAYCVPVEVFPVMSSFETLQ